MFKIYTAECLHVCFFLTEAPAELTGQKDSGWSPLHPPLDLTVVDILVVMEDRVADGVIASEKIQQGAIKSRGLRRPLSICRCCTKLRQSSVTCSRTEAGCECQIYSQKLILE